MLRDSLSDLGIRVLVLSCGRYKTATTQKLLPEWVEWVVPESEAEEYRECLGVEIVTHPDSIVTLGTTRNWILDNFSERTIVMLDDDISKVYAQTGELSRRVTDPEEIIQIIVCAAQMAIDMGAHVFSFCQSDIRKYKGYEPFSLSTWGGTVVGVIGRKYRFEDGRNKADADFFLKNLLVDRIIFVDNRYYFWNLKNVNTGGSASLKTEMTESDDWEYMQRRWGNYFKRTKRKGQYSLHLSVPRRQKL